MGEAETRKKGGAEELERGFVREVADREDVK
jgi:hypothetical protein